MTSPMRCIIAAALLSVASADVYMQNPRGSNNKLNEVSNNVNNANRLFDSQYVAIHHCNPIGQYGLPTLNLLNSTLVPDTHTPTHTHTHARTLRTTLPSPRNNGNAGYHVGGTQREGG